ncbi:hypothetical protein DASC09_022740 [Saccharomycopsis crataegensis]|uniref:RING-type domain-containing protein n=1 Tax=Saccharomycopsis crataegensis TaxID=43959 RepID=A0AAV5QKK5_9ASCO|nr:hypothetical protein DASC09_022740 [Saccharomycopsis crataegensis]
MPEKPTRSALSPLSKLVKHPSSVPFFPSPPKFSKTRGSSPLTIFTAHSNKSQKPSNSFFSSNGNKRSFSSSSSSSSSSFSSSSPSSPLASSPSDIVKRHSISSTSSSTTTSSSLSSSKNKSSSKHPKYRKPSHRRSIVGSNCALCADKFQVSLAATETKIIELTCGHDCHWDCFLGHMDRQNINQFPHCMTCGKVVRPANSQDLEAILESALSRGGNEFMYPLMPVYDASLGSEILISPTYLEDKSLVTPITASTIKSSFSDKVFNGQQSSADEYLQNPFLSSPEIGINIEEELPQVEPRGLVSHDEQLIDEMTKPKITIIPEYSTLVLNESTKKHELPCVLNIQLNEHCLPNDLQQDEIEVEHENHKVLSNWVIQNMLGKLDNFANFNITPCKVKEDAFLITENYQENQEINDEKSKVDDDDDDDDGDMLVMFDVLQVEEAGDWEIYQFYLFDKGKLLLVDASKNMVCGNIKYKSDLTSITKQDVNTLILRFSSLELPELKIKSSDRLIIRKWENYLNYQINNSKSSIGLKSNNCLTSKMTPFVPLIQMTTNAWGLIDRRFIPEEVKHMNDLLANSMELPLPLLKKLIPSPDAPPIRLIMCISLINKQFPKISNECYMNQIKEVVKDAITHLNPACDKFGFVYISKQVDNKTIKKISSYITGISDWESMEKQFNYLQIYDDDPDQQINNLEEQVLYLDASERLLEFWGDCEYDPTKPDYENFQYVKKLLMITDGYEDAKTGNYNMQSYQDKVYNKMLGKLLKRIIRSFKFSIHAHLSQSKIDHYTIRFLQCLISENYHTFGSNFTRIGSINDINIPDLIINHWRKVVVPCLRVNLKSLKPQSVKLCKNEFKNNQLNLLECLLESPNDMANNDACLVMTDNRGIIDDEVEYYGNINAPSSSGSGSISSYIMNDNSTASMSTLNVNKVRRFSCNIVGANSSPRTDCSNIGGKNLMSRDSLSSTTSSSSGLLTSLSICSTPLRTNFNPRLFGSSRSYAAEIDAVSYLANDDDEEETEDGNSEKEELDIFINDITPGYCKNIIINSVFDFNRRFKQIIKYSTDATRIDEQFSNEKSGISGMFLCPLLQYFASYANEKLAPQDLSVEICLSGKKYDDDNVSDEITSSSQYAASRDSIRKSVNSLLSRESSLFRTLSTRRKPSSLAINQNECDEDDDDDDDNDDEFELPVFTIPLSNDRDHLYAKRQIQLTVISTLIYSLKLISSKNPNDATPEEVKAKAIAAKSLVLGLTSSIFAMGKNCSGVNPAAVSAMDFGRTASGKFDGGLVEEEKNLKYIEYLSFILGLIGNLLLEKPEEAFVSCYELICDLCFQ